MVERKLLDNFFVTSRLKKPILLFNIVFLFIVGLCRYLTILLQSENRHIDSSCRRFFSSSLQFPKFQIFFISLPSKFSEMEIEDCDIFLSFRGETRNNFTCYLYEKLKLQGFKPFMDRENIHVGDEIDRKIKKAIKYSKSAIIVLSENYPSSKHCLDELVHILERNRTSKYFIIPIFYYVTAADVKYQRGKFGDAFEQVKKRHSNEKVVKWRAALAEVGDILAQEINEKDPRTESKIIEDIVTSFTQKYSEHYQRGLLDLKATNVSSIVSQQNRYQVLSTTDSYRFNIEEGSVEVTKDNAKSITNKYEDMTFRSWMKDWMINNPKFLILVIIVVTVIIIFTVVTFIQISIEAGAADTVNSVFKDMGPKNFPSTFEDTDYGRKESIWNPKNFPTDMDSRTTKIIWNPNGHRRSHDNMSGKLLIVCLCFFLLL